MNDEDRERVRAERKLMDDSYYAGISDDEILEIVECIRQIKRVVGYRIAGKTYLNLDL